MPLPKEEFYTIKDIYALPDGQRAELIDGRIYNMAPPNRIHQKISWKLHQTIGNYISAKKGICEVYAAPFSVFLNEDDKNYVEPDISVICDKSKLDDKGCIGAPDWIIEITSPSNPENDYGIKLFKYRTAGVREYWIVNPQKQAVIVYDFEQEKRTNHYSFEDTIPVCIYEDLNICIADLLEI
ncbi:MAG: Uma2 family endonuclease [Lachnospiraceae bacterium]|nr:Uma2 family endonuclease [Lachnospiraceae bacterium]